MNALFVYPKFAETFWSWKWALKFVGKKAAFPPLGLITAAAMFSKSWEKKLVDLSVCDLADEDINWADYVFVSAMAAQSDSTKAVILRCKENNVPVVLGGPILQQGCEEFGDVSHFLLGEAENILIEFLSDLQANNAKRIYSAKSFPELADSPIPLWKLLNIDAYASMLVQYGRGCPHKCTFCNVATINGRVPRVKSPEQFLRELDALYDTGFLGAVMFADDNLIGNKPRAREMLAGLVEWQKKHGYPFEFTAEVDITLAEEDDLMDLMVQAGFKKVFLGLETPNNGSLIECGKTQNAKRDMVACVRKLLQHGLIPMSGFIVGFDADNPRIFVKQMVRFIQEAPIVVAMVGVLQAPPGAELYRNMEKEGRLRDKSTGNNLDLYPNFETKMSVDILVAGFKKIWATIYSPRVYYERIETLLREYNAETKPVGKMTAPDIGAFWASVWRIGFLGGPVVSYYYWKTLLLAFFKYPKALPEAVAFQIYGAHFRRIAKNIKRA